MYRHFAFSYLHIEHLNDEVLEVVAIVVLFPLFTKRES